MAVVLSDIYIYYAHFIKDFTLTITTSSGTSTIYTKDDATLDENRDCYVVGYDNYGNATFTIEGEGFMRQEGELGGSVTINIYLQPKPNELYAYSKEEGIAMYAWTVESTDVISPEAARTVYTETPILDYSGNNVYMLVDGEYQVVGLSTMESINGIGGEFYVRESNNEYIEMELTGPI